MPDIIIRGLGLPKEDELLSINIWPNGSVTIAMDLECKPVARAVELPPHGDLIDRDALIEVCNEMSAEDWNINTAPYSWAYAYESFVDDVEDIPVIIPATEEANST